MYRPITYSEIFHSFQGEGYYTGTSTAWIRLFKCNLQCDGFGQKDPTNKSTYMLPRKTFEITPDIKSMVDLPVFEYGCDSSYSWFAKFNKLSKQDHAEVVCSKISRTLEDISNPEGLFKHPVSNQHTHMAFTGGEPMVSQQSILDILMEFDKIGNSPQYVTIETNGTQLFRPNVKLDQYIANHQHNWFWSVSPKLFNTSGEINKKAIKPLVVQQYKNISDHGQLKFVVNNNENCWEELQRIVHLFQSYDIDWPIYVMPVGATKEQQQNAEIQDIINKAIKNGYHVSPRSHCYVYGNKIGT